VLLNAYVNPYAERLIGTIRRECLDHVIVFSEGHLRQILREYFRYYHEVRPHQSLKRNSPVLREVELPSKGRVISIWQVGGLHHRYSGAGERHFSNNLANLAICPVNGVLRLA
jgi:hypothetical protein